MKAKSSIKKAMQREASTLSVREYMAIAIMAGMYGDSRGRGSAAEIAAQAVNGADTLIEELARKRS